MAHGLISKKYLIDAAEAIRVMLNSESTYTPEQMASAIEDITGTITGTITKSSNTDVGLITDTLLDGICDALRIKLDDNTLTFTPAQIADAILSITGGSVDVVSFSSGTDAQIGAMIDAAHNDGFNLQTDGGWSVGDSRTITVGAFTDGAGNTHTQQNIDIVISSFNDYESCGCVMQFDFKTTFANPIRLNNTSSNGDGYGTMEIKTTTLPSIVNVLPDWIKRRLIEFSCRAASPYTVTPISGNKLALRSYIEITGLSDQSRPNEGAQIPYYSTKSNRIKGNTYWTRSPYNGNTSAYMLLIVQSDSSTYWAPNNQNGYIAPFGCL